MDSPSKNKSKNTKQSEKPQRPSIPKDSESKEQKDTEQHLLLDDESNLIPRRNNAEAWVEENKQQQEDAERGDAGVSTGEENTRQQQQSSKGKGKQKDVLSENTQLKSQLQNLKTEYKQVRQRYEKLKQRWRSERKVLRKYRRLLIGAFETNNLPLFQEENSEDPQSVSVPSDSPLEENSEKRLEVSREELDKREQLDQPFESHVDPQQSREASFTDVEEDEKNVASACACASAATGGQGTAATAAAAAAAVASNPVDPGSSSVHKNKRKRDFVSSKDSSWSSEPQSSSSTLSKDALDMYEPDEQQQQQQQQQQQEDEEPSQYKEADNFRLSYNESNESRRGRHSIWKPEEERLFDQGFRRYGCRWKLIQENFLPQKSRQQIQSHGTYLLRQGRLRKYQGGKHRKSIRESGEKSPTNEESSRPVRQYESTAI
jgi:hypothetical protein